MSSYKLDDLEVYKRSEKLSDEIWDEVISWKDYFVKDTIGKQLVRSADSIGANIAEGYGRFHYKENRNFCYFSRGSIMETKSWLTKLKTRNIIEPAKADRLLDELTQVHKMLNSYIKFIGTTKAAPTNS
ncbi:MAG TPA: four helix bundle protein [Pedobacter sp.]|jgi:four helix bundle protein